jgi:hypothetical protein
MRIIMLDTQKVFQVQLVTSLCYFIALLLLVFVFFSLSMHELEIRETDGAERLESLTNIAQRHYPTDLHLRRHK